MKGRRRREAARALNRRQVIRACAIIGAVSLLAIGVGLWSLLGLLADSNRKIDALYSSANANYSKLVAVGQQPVGPPPQQIVGKQGPPGQVGATGAAGASGPQGPPGRDGRDGRNATPAEVAAAVAAYLHVHPVRNGTDGRDGRDGQPGADGITPACVVEVEECRGRTGPAGPAGADGAAGADGNPPAAWTWTDPVTKASFECRRDTSSPDSAPAYSCTVVT
jgi:hypothetical protein